jgi:coenzyme F420-0:L-glutamate ligase/coenzyme F420-1:gamma-L-glutamate ligase
VALVALPDVRLVRPGDDLANLLIDAVERADLVPRHRDVFVIAQKIVSKPKGRYVDLADVSPSPGARQLAAAAGKDPRLQLSPACRPCRAVAGHI